jgi:hypothetical protein
LFARAVAVGWGQVRDVDDRLARLVECHAPQLRDVVGIGPDVAVTLLITAGDNPQGLT